MRVELTPTIAACLANAVYGIREQVNNVARGVVERGEEDLLSHPDLDFANAKVVSGVSGAGIYATSGFTLVIPGKNTLAGEYVVATRGTATAYDGLTDAVAALESGPGGHPVHAGFNRVAKSVSDGVRQALVGKNPSRIHCVGHSLGGAIANILALQLNSQIAEVSLYTFGAPRTGGDHFCQALSHSLGDDNVYRGFSLRDPVPMVPIYPFLHAPTALRGALVGNSMGPVWHTQHFMTAYKPAVADLTWRALRLRAQETPLSTEELLQRAAESVRIPGLGIALHWLGRALGAILSTIDRLLGSAATAGLTVIDRMAYMLMSGKAQDAKLDDQITRLISYVVAFAGIPIAAGTMVKVAFLNYLLGFILRPLVGNARTALAQTHA